MTVHRARGVLLCLVRLALVLLPALTACGGGTDADAAADVVEEADLGSDVEPDDGVAPDDGSPPEDTAGDAETDAEPEADTEAGGCGDHVVDPGEECDDGNTEPDDGCEPDCSFGCADAASCDDGLPCTTDACEPLGAGRACTHAAAVGAGCDDGDPCTSPDTCGADGTCGPGPSVCDCPGGTDAECAAYEDGDACNGTLRCVGVVCEPDPATVVVCPAGPLCSRYVCDPADGSCDLTPLDTGTDCSDGTFCNGPEACDGSGRCVAGPLPCPAGPCAAGCDDTTGSCTYASSATTCRPAASACDVAELCAGTGPTCPDDLFAAPGAACDDGDRCNSNDVCDAAGACAGRPEPPQRLWVLFFEPRIAAGSGRWGVLRLASRDVTATAWDLQTVASGLYDSSGYTYGSAELAIDSLGRPHVAYMAFTARELRYTRWDGTAWVRADGTAGHDVVDTDVFTYNARHFLVLRGDVPHLAYRQDTNLKYYRWAPGGWVREVALALFPATGRPNPGGGPALVLDAAGRPHVAHHDHDIYRLHYAHFDGTAWGNEELIHTPTMVGEYKNIGLDVLGRPHLAFQAGYTRWSGTAWVRADGTPGYDAFDASMISAAFTPTGTVLMGAHAGGSLVVYRRPIDGGAWDAGTTVAPDTSMVDFVGDRVCGVHVALVRSVAGGGAEVAYLHEGVSGPWPAETVYGVPSTSRVVHPTLAVWP